MLTKVKRTSCLIFIVWMGPAVLFDLEHTARRNDVKSCTSDECQWIKRAKTNTNSCSLQNLKLTKLEYGKQENTCPTVENFEPRTRNPDPSTLCKELRDDLQNVCSSAVVLHVLPQPELPNVSEEIPQCRGTCRLCERGRGC